MKTQENMLHFSGLSICTALERTETANTCAFLSCSTQWCSCKELAVEAFYTLSTGQNSLLEEEQKLLKGHSHDYYSGNTGNGKREWGIKLVQRNSRN